MPIGRLSYSYIYTKNEFSYLTIKKYKKASSLTCAYAAWAIEPLTNILITKWYQDKRVCLNGSR